MPITDRVLTAHMMLRDAFKPIPKAHLLLFTTYPLRVAAAAILIVALVVPVAAQQYPSPPFYQLLPPDYPYPLIRVCSTQWGICAIPAGIVPGTPCSCLAAYGGWLPGVCVR